MFIKGDVLNTFKAESSVFGSWPLPIRMNIHYEMIAARKGLRFSEYMYVLNVGMFYQTYFQFGRPQIGYK